MKAALLLGCCCATLAGLAPPSGAEESHVRARLVCETTALVPGTTAHIGIRFQIDAGWHLFWNGCNNTGYPITVSPDLPDGITAGELQWPAPKRLVSPGDILDHVYEGDVLLILPVEVPEDLAAGDDVALSCGLEWVSCHDACVVGGGTAAMRIPVVPADAKSEPSADAPLFERTRARLAKLSITEAGIRPRDEKPGTAPKTPIFVPGLSHRWEKTALVFEAQGARSMTFHPSGGCESLADPIADCAAPGGRLSIRHRAVDGKLGPASGILEVDWPGKSAPQFYVVQLSVPFESSSPSTESH